MSEHGIIIDLFWLTLDHYVYEAGQLTVKFHISGVPITVEGKFVGIITNHLRVTWRARFTS